MEKKTLNGSKRTELRTGAARRLRRSGHIPAVIYGHREPAPVAFDAREFSAVIRNPAESGIVTLAVDGENFDVIVKDFQADAITGRILHVDFFEIERGKSFRTHVPLHIHGSSPGVREGGVLEQHLHDLEIECLPKDLPSEIVVDISRMDAGHSIHVGDLAIPDGVKVLSSEDMVIITVSHQKAVTTAEQEEGEEGDIAAAAGGESSEEGE